MHIEKVGLEPMLMIWMHRHVSATVPSGHQWNVYDSLGWFCGPGPGSGSGTGFLSLKGNQGVALGRSRMTGSAAKRSGRCVMLELKERGVPGGEGTAIIPERTGHYAGGSVKNGSKNGPPFYMIWGPFRGVKMS